MRKKYESKLNSEKIQYLGDKTGRKVKNISEKRLTKEEIWSTHYFFLSLPTGFFL
ncbi:hypothetical protein B0I21_10659 [Sphingobacterium paludis]|uniref:Uncharacterized protein n=1 Tax=Sphingobacterium paludis TaxID=1476465 RepID=A0A4R7CYJ4_9SPHI|nr:hypothetical protein B0I21_10659 [Sphingobacterium paludis]